MNQAPAGAATPPWPRGADVRVAARCVLHASVPEDKTRLAGLVLRDWQAGALAPPLPDDTNFAPARPARPARPVLVAPGKVARRRLTSPAGRGALLHAVAHIEFNAIDLAFDLVARFAGGPDLENADRARFAEDWITVGSDEARHFALLQARLDSVGMRYGDLPAHNGLWMAAQATQTDLAARLGVAPMVLEARGLDVTPAMITRLRAAGDADSAASLEVIYAEEHAHVAAGTVWFHRIAARRGLDPKSLFHAIVNGHARGALKAPFNETARTAAGLQADFYQPLAENTPE